LSPRALDQSEAGRAGHVDEWREAEKVKSGASTHHPLFTFDALQRRIGVTRGV
jgi:hypothetical protein